MLSAGWREGGVASWKGMTDLQLVKSMVVTCCALQSLYESHEEVYETEWDAAAAATAVELGVAVPQGAEEKGRDVCQGLMHLLNS